MINLLKNSFERANMLLTLFSYAAAPALLLYLSPCLLFLAQPTANESILGCVLFYVLGWNFGKMQGQWETEGCSDDSQGYSLPAISGLAFVWYGLVVYFRIQVLNQPAIQLFPLVLVVPPVVAFMVKLQVNFFLHSAKHDRWRRERESER